MNTTMMDDLLVINNNKSYDHTLEVAKNNSSNKTSLVMETSSVVDIAFS